MYMKLRPLMDKYVTSLLKKENIYTTYNFKFERCYFKFEKITISREKKNYR